jgi:hypothetical protein
MRRHWWVGIDPGKTGALAVIVEVNENLVLHKLVDTPLRTIPGTQRKKEYDAAGIDSLISGVASVSMSVPGTIIRAALERTWAWPRQGSRTSFSSGFGYGLWWMALTASHVPFIVPEPATWQEWRGLIGRDKAASRTLAERDFPDANLGRRKSEDRADAIALALYARYCYLTTQSA